MNQKLYAADTFFKPDGSLNTDCTAPMSIVCLGGSLTESGAEWVEMVRAFFEKTFPHRQVAAHNVGVGGTDSCFGALRFKQHVAPFAPDFLIVEFTVNDKNKSEQEVKTYMESLVQQCLQLDKIPSIVFGYSPLAIAKDDKEYPSWCEHAAWAGEVARHYGIKDVNLYDYFDKCYEAAKGDTSLTYLDYISDIYNPSPWGGYDVHPIKTGRGYRMYGEAYTQAFAEDLAGTLIAPQSAPLLTSERHADVNATYNWIAAGDDRLIYEGDWEMWTKENPCRVSDSRAGIWVRRYDFPFMPDGITRAYKQKGASFTLQTTANSLFLYGHGAAAFCNGKLYVDGVECGAVPMVPHEQPFRSQELPLHNEENKPVTVKILVDDPTDEQYVFTFGYVIEKFSGK